MTQIVDMSIDQVFEQNKRMIANHAQVIDIKPIRWPLVALNNTIVLKKTKYGAQLKRGVQ